MNKVYLLISILIPVVLGMSYYSSTTVHSESIAADSWTDMASAQRQASEHGKLVLIDFYTDWCGYCKRMDKEVYPDESVKSTISEYFIPVKINAESKAAVTFNETELTMEQLAYAFRVSSYPSTAFVNAEGQVITVVPGFMPAENFNDLLEFIGSDAWQTQSFDEFMEARNG